jgi:hypothetical protein
MTIPPYLSTTVWYFYGATGLPITAAEVSFKAGGGANNAGASASGSGTSTSKASLAAPKLPNQMNLMLHMAVFSLFLLLS